MDKFMQMNWGARLVVLVKQWYVWCGVLLAIVAVNATLYQISEQWKWATARPGSISSSYENKLRVANEYATRINGILTVSLGNVASLQKAQDEGVASDPDFEVLLDDLAIAQTLVQRLQEELRTGPRETGFLVPSEWALISQAHAQATNVGFDPSDIDLMKPYIMLGVIVTITSFFFICVCLFCLTKDQEKVKFADSMMRTIVGFYIGVVTGLLGLPTA